MKAWHYLKEDRRIRFRDGKEVDDGEIVEVGKTYTAKGKLVLCKNGMHGSISPLDALQYAPGPIVCRVNIIGEIQKGDDKIIGRNRKVLWMYDATDVLRKFSRMCALDVVYLWDAPDVVVQYLQVGKEELRDAAWDAAWAAARDAAGDAAKGRQSRRLHRMLMAGNQ